MVNLSNIHPGSFLQIVPLGILGTLHYNDKGILTEFVKLDGETLDPQFTVYLEKEKILPQRIGMPGNETKIFGVIYTNQRFNTCGKLPECLESDMIKDLKRHPELYKFYAVDIENPVLKFSGGLSKQNRLSTLGFDIVFGYNVAKNLNEASLQTMVNSGKYPFSYPAISGMMVTDIQGHSEYYPQELEQHKIKSIKDRLDKNGYIRADIKYESGDFSTSYTDVVRYNLKSGVIFVIGNNQVVHSYVPPQNRVSNIIKCSICGKQIAVPTTGVVTCSDPHCRSIIFNDVNHLLNSLNLPTLGFDEFISYIKSGKLMNISDIFNIEPYTDNIECTLNQIIRGVVPVHVCSNNSFIDDLVIGTSSLSGLTYYLNNPESLKTDLKLDPVTLNKFILWLRDSYNVQIIDAILSKDNIKVVEKVSKFDGAPIFRNKTICITGKFKHGSHSYVSDVITSYSGKVVNKFNNSVNCVVVGQFRDEDEEIIACARSYNIPIYREADFFKYYLIDEDLEN